MKCLLKKKPKTVWDYYGIAQRNQRFSSSIVDCKYLCCFYITWCGFHQCKAQRIWWICIKFIAHLLVFLELLKTLGNNLGGGKKPFEMNFMAEGQKITFISYPSPRWWSFSLVPIQANSTQQYPKTLSRIQKSKIK